MPFHGAPIGSPVRALPFLEAERPPWLPPIKAPHLGARLGAPFQTPNWETVPPHSKNCFWKRCLSQL
eukprot:7277203-Pyramimonas_sp.AAC.1